MSSVITSDFQFYSSKKKLRFDTTRITRVFSGVYNKRLVFYSGQDRKVFLSHKFKDITYNPETYEIEALRGLVIEHIALGEHFMIVKTRTSIDSDSFCYLTNFFFSHYTFWYWLQ